MWRGRTVRADKSKRLPRRRVSHVHPRRARRADCGGCGSATRILLLAALGTFVLPLLMLGPEQQRSPITVAKMRRDTVCSPFGAGSST